MTFNINITNDELALNNRNQKKISKNKNAHALCIHTNHADADADADSNADSDAYVDAYVDANSDADSNAYSDADSDDDSTGYGCR